MKNLTQTILWTAIVTPLKSDGSIDFPSFQQLLKRQERANNSVVLLGSTGEGLALSRMEKESIVKFAVALKLAIPLLCGVPGHQLEETLDWVRFARAAGIDGFLAVTPYYSKPDALGQTAWFEKVLEEAKLPVMLYNVPSRTGVKLNPQVLKNLKGNPYLWAVKESSGSVKIFQELQAANPDLTYYCGDDALMAEFAAHGAVGLVSVCANIWPEATRRYVTLCRQKQTTALYPLWKDSTDALFLASNPVPVKWILFQDRQIPTPLTRAPLSTDDFKNTEPLTLAHRNIQEWLADQERR